jgi:transposase InsO family protein
VLLDIFSRYVVGWMVAERESSALAARLIEQTCVKQGIGPHTLTLHSDRGAPMTSKCTAQLLADLGVTRSLSRPQVSDDNPFSEAQFKTLKYHPSFPGQFDDIAATVAFCRSFFPWYNTEHRHAGIAMLTPHDVHYGRASRILENANEPFALPGAGSRSDSSTEPRSPSLFRKRSGSTHRPRLRQHGLLSKSQPSVSQCR